MRRSTDCLLAASRKACNSLQRLCLALFCLAVAGCEREPVLNLHQGGTDIGIVVPTVDLDLHVVWNYLFKYDVEYDWQAEWLYGWDDTDRSLFGPIGYTEPQAFDVRRYFTGSVPCGPHTSPYSHTLNGHYLRAATISAIGTSWHGTPSTPPMAYRVFASTSSRPTTMSRPTQARQ